MGLSQSLTAQADDDAADVDPELQPPTQRCLLPRGQWSVVRVVTPGAAMGVSTRHGWRGYGRTQRAGSLGQRRGPMPWTNAVGCTVISVFMVAITDVWTAHRPVRPFSAYAMGDERMVDGRAGRALAYLGAMLAAALTAGWPAVWVTCRVLQWRER